VICFAQNSPLSTFHFKIRDEILTFKSEILICSFAFLQIFCQKFALIRLGYGTTERKGSLLQKQEMQIFEMDSTKINSREGLTSIKP
jgi:hypothetical protein